MSNNINSRSSFFPQSKNATKLDRASHVPKSNSAQKQQYIDSYTKRDAKVDIPEAVKDFSKIKKAVDAAPQMDKSDKIAALKQQIQAGTYKVDYDGLADKIFAEEFGHESR